MDEPGIEARGPNANPGIDARGPNVDPGFDARSPNADERGPKLMLRTPLDCATPVHEEWRVMEAQASWRAAFSSLLRRAIPMPVAPQSIAKQMAIQLHTAHGRYARVATPSVPAM